MTFIAMTTAIGVAVQRYWRRPLSTRGHDELGATDHDREQRRDVRRRGTGRKRAALARAKGVADDAGDDGGVAGTPPSTLHHRPFATQTSATDPSVPGEAVTGVGGVGRQPHRHMHPSVLVRCRTERDRCVGVSWHASPCRGVSCSARPSESAREPAFCPRSRPGGAGHRVPRRDDTPAITQRDIWG